MAIHNIFLSFLSKVSNTSIKTIVNADMEDAIRSSIATNESSLKYILYHTWKDEKQEIYPLIRYIYYVLMV